MFSYIYGADVFGMEARIIRVEADVNDGLPVFDMVGYLASAVKEARERVRIAIRNAGVFFPAKRITINLSPANLRKEGASFDLPIAVALLSSFAVIPYDEHKKYLIIGELGLDGKIHGVNGILAMILEGMQQGITNFIIPKENEQECSIVDCDNIYVASDIDEVIKHFREDKTLKKVESQYDNFVLQGETKDDFIDVIGQSALKRAAEIAVSGRHNLLILGPPGTGKTMLARRIPTIMPKLTKEEQLELTKIYSISGKLTENMPIIVNRPFRSPHHSSTPISLTGGGRIPTPGEITLASKGVLFLDELPEFSRASIEVLRQPMEDGYITISRVGHSFEYPSDTMYVAAMNPCRCGFYPDMQKCRCTSADIHNYLGKISEPLLDRLDICVEASLPEFRPKNNASEDSATIRNRVEKVYKIQNERYVDESFLYNSQVPESLLDKYCYLGEKEMDYLEKFYQSEGCSMRQISRIRRVARTIADMDSSDVIMRKHLSEAILFRSINKRYWR